MSRKSEFVKIKDRLDSMYDTSDVSLNYRYWFTRLLNFTLELFKWKGLPDSINGREIEIQLQLSGHCVLYMNKGEIKTSNTCIYDFDDYYNPIKFNYAQPKQGSKSNLQIDSRTSCIVYNNILNDNIWNVPVDGSLYSFLGHYARQLADISSTINIYIVNMRISDYPVAKNDKTQKSLEKFFDMFRLGKHAIITQNDEIFDAFKNVERGKTRTPDTLMSLLDSQDRILEKFFRDIGVKFRQAKRAQMNEEEIESDEQLLLINPANMLEERRKGVKKINDTFGLSVSVDINENFKRDNFSSKIALTQKMQGGVEE